MKKIYATHSNHFDLLWRRTWEMPCEYEGKRWLSYSELEELVIARNIELAETGRGAYQVEQALTMRKYLERHPADLKRVKALYRQGLWEMHGSGEAIIDVNLCNLETMIRNMASGVRYCKDVLEMPPLSAYHADGFGSSAQFPQVIGGCGLDVVLGLSYRPAGGKIWRGIDGSEIWCEVWGDGQTYFFDHCYHEPCRSCDGYNRESCKVCKGAGIDLPQNFYPELKPVDPKDVDGPAGVYSICSEEMLPHDGMNANFAKWQKEDPDVSYEWGTSRMTFAAVYKADRKKHGAAFVAAQVDNNPVMNAAVVTPKRPSGLLSPGVDNNPVLNGCHVTRIRTKTEARRCEANFLGWETALALTNGLDVRPKEWRQHFLELPLFFFHDSVTGTSMDIAARELMLRLYAHQRNTRKLAVKTLRRTTKGNASSEQWRRNLNKQFTVFGLSPQKNACRAELPDFDWRSGEHYVLVDQAGKRHPVIPALHADSPALPTVTYRSSSAVGPSTRNRPDTCSMFAEFSKLDPLQWSEFSIEKTAGPTPITGPKLSNRHVTVTLGDNGVEAIIDRASGASMKAGAIKIGELFVEEDNGNPWGTRKIPEWRKGTAQYTEFLGALQFDGYQEAYYGGHWLPSKVFASEGDPEILWIEWYVTFRLLRDARRVDVSVELFWKTSNRRIRVAFPTASTSNTGTYSIPGGWLERKRYEMKETHLWSPNGDWPAVNFVANKPRKGKPGFAVINYGTPSARIENGTMFCSVLRSPAFGYCLNHYCINYPMPTTGTKDHGWHFFEFSIVPHFGRMPDLALQADARNQLLPTTLAPAGTMPQTPLLAVKGSGVQLVSVKQPFDEKQNGYVLRLLNINDRKTTATLTFAETRGLRVRECNMIEEAGKPIKQFAKGVYRIALGPFEVKTFIVSAT